MKIVHQSRDRLVLAGRRLDGEVGEDGLWILWLVGSGFLGVGAAFAFFSTERVVGAIAASFGVAILTFGLYRLARREELRFDRESREGRYTTYLWPRSARDEFTFGVDRLRGLEIRWLTESPGPGHRGPSRAYRKTEARLLVKPRRKIVLDRHQDDARVRSMAASVATFCDVEIRDVTTPDEAREE